MKYPQFERLTVYVMPRHIEHLNRVFYDDGTNRSEQTRQALDLLIAKSNNDDKPEAEENDKS